MLRHLDRGSQEIDNGHYLNFKYVFAQPPPRGAAPQIEIRSRFDDFSSIAKMPM